MLDIQQLSEQISDAAVQKRPLEIKGGGSKSFYGHPVSGQAIDLTPHRGIITYEPAELVITARAGTPLQEIEKLLNQNGQMLGFEPPSFSPSATLGGTIACGLSGPRRPYSGAARDFILGATVLNGKGEVLKFGGEVMKNVAGYDISRLMCGAQGTLGILLDISLKVIPKPNSEKTLKLSCHQPRMLKLLSELGRKPFPISATTFYDNQLYIRLSGAQGGVKQAINAIGGEIEDAASIWQQVKEQTHPFFHTQGHLLRASLPPMAPSIPEEFYDPDILIEWGGAQRWLYGANDDALNSWIKDNGGHLSNFRNTSPCAAQHLNPALFALHKRIKHSFDPSGILNPGRLFSSL